MSKFSLNQTSGTSPILPTLFVVPTGIGCSIGGFAGDAIPSARLLAAASGCLITHPNVMNGASLYWNDTRIQYVEGYALDRFAIGELALRPVRQQKVGLLLDAGLEPALRQRHLQVADGCRASLGLNVGPVVTTEVPLEVRTCTSASGVSSGVIGQPEALLRAGDVLKKAGATAIAVVTRFPDDYVVETLEAYRGGRGVDALAGAEAVISHLLVRHLCIPCAHAPALKTLPIDEKLDPRAAGEEIGHTFLSCVLVGLSRAPDLISLLPKDSGDKRVIPEALNRDQLGAIVAPYDALGGEAVLACLEMGLPLITVTNKSVLDVTPEALGLKEELRKIDVSSVMHAQNYLEAAGLLMLLREGISPEAVSRPITGIAKLD